MFLLLFLSGWFCIDFKCYVDLDHNVKHVIQLKLNECFSVHGCICVEKKTNYMSMNVIQFFQHVPFTVLFAYVFS
jgi:hypothetical protein